MRYIVRILFILVMSVSTIQALERPDVEFKIFQFPGNMIPCIDGNTVDWDIVPDEYGIGIDQLVDTVFDVKTDPEDKDITVKVGWVNGLSRLYFLVETYDDYWDFNETNLENETYPYLHNDIFELVVDGDLSGGPLIPQLRTDNEPLGRWNQYLFHGVHAQNYHIFTPAEGKPWTMVWGCQPWIYEFPWANASYSYNFKHGENGNLVLEFWITPFDYAPFEGPDRAIVSRLIENKIIGLSWSILEYDGINDTGRNKAFWNLSHKTTFYGNASELVAFRLMPLEERFHKPIEAQWSFKIINMDKRIVAFKDESYGNITSWLWDFGDGTTSTEQHPVHQYKGPGLRIPGGNYQYQYAVALHVEGPEGKARMLKVWDVAVK